MKGSFAETYEVKIEVVPTGRGIYLESKCSCPYQNQCKHAVAVAYYALEHDFVVEDVQLPDDVAPPVVAPAAVLLDEVEMPLPHEVSDWLERMAIRTVDPDEFDVTAKSRLFYVLRTKATANGADSPTVTLMNRSVLKAGVYGAHSEFKAATVTSGNLPKYLNAYDRNLVVDIDRNAVKLDWNRAEYRLDGSHGSRLLQAILDSGRCIWKDIARGICLKPGPKLAGVVRWQEAGDEGKLQPCLDFGRSGAILSVAPPWYVDEESGQCGPIECDLPDSVAASFLRIGPIRPEVLPVVRKRLSALGYSGSALPTPKFRTVLRSPLPTPCLLVQYENCCRTSFTWNQAKISAPIAFAKLTFEYEGIVADPDGSDIRIVTDEQILILKRNPSAESVARERLVRNGWIEPSYCGWEIPKSRSDSLCVVPPDDYRLHYPIERIQQMKEGLFAKLIGLGWRIDVEGRYRIVADEDVEWDLGLDSGSGIDWFEFQVGIKVEGKPFDLKAVLKGLFAEQSALKFRSGRARGPHETEDVYIFDEEGRAVRLPRARLNAILSPLLELFGGVQEWPDDLRLPKSMLSEASIFEDTVEDADLPWRTSEEIRGLSARLAAFDHLEPMMEPAGFIGELRGYQREGLAWLDFLREYEFGGILADDMGLGKTVQILAFLQREKLAGRLNSPALIVAPTSTIPNWKRECERFTPELSVVSLQGAGRHGRFAELDGCDIALTTYPLLARDKDHLKNAKYHAIVLDEAQNVKNPITIAARAARDLNARHRFCLSGTPVENHLGELWSLFHFLMPGFLGSDVDFKRRFRGPIEKNGDTDARDRLARRIRPFMLRRTKDKVVKELPAKTEIIENVELDEKQRDLYETIRLAMDEQVRHLIAAQGFDRSRIQILDALLKLRQVCCDPRLVKLPSAENVTDSAKLDRLLDMLTVLIEDGRKVLLFSQFTSMLNIIEERLREAKIEWVRISGDVIDRDTPVQRFQAGDVPLFLISLKAGGTGLNLTAADTVILYDPWWNPAVENQAIDRAHRIGQDKPVMVYRLVASATIEEKMLVMQARKGELAKSILTDDGDVIRTLTVEDLQWVLSKD
ncbi:MAG: DEAD/DEAH box helicase [Fimbriimonas sp.]|nr:DEAD/DEAH box helicase [Fimbriimonas sp.]